MKIRLLLLISFIAISVYSQDQVDIGTPVNSPFHLGGDIQGTIQNSVNEVTGKVTFSTPLASISASSVSYGVSLTYNGQTAFKNGKETNKYNPTSVAGVGWSLGVPKIVVDNKGTGTRDDDVFYLLDGATNTKLICTNRGSTVNGSAWEFQMEKYAPWKIYFYYHTGWGDYWKIVKENGLTYYFGSQNVKDGKEFAVRYGNWIGSSKKNGATSEQTIVWNITKIEDQWGNNVTFAYNTVKQFISGKDQTEAAYLTHVRSSNGARIQLVYGAKNIDEYYEPHKESSEPDAYQERYEKKYLQSVSSFNSKNQLISSYNIGYTLNGTNLNKKRYLTSLTQTVYNNGQNEISPPQEFEYYYTGDFKGGIKKITYPTGGAVTYNYKSKLLFGNYANQYQNTSFSQPNGYQYHSSYVSDNYGLFVYRTQNTVIGDKYRFKFYRVWWNGEKWEWDEFTFPYLMKSDLDNFHLILKQDFYGFAYDRGTIADIYLWHIENNGRTWDYYTSTRINVGDGDPSFVSGNGFVALQSHRRGELYTYVWNGSSWNYKRINQGVGQYYIAAKNNYIISLDEDGGADMVTNVNHEDNYYMHYLDAEKKWQTKSWSATADPHIHGVEKASYFYPDNSIIGFVADDNRELFLRWDINYNLTNVDNVLGAYNDSFPIVPVSNSMFTIHHSFYKLPNKSTRFNGVSWDIGTVPTTTTYYAKLNFGEDIVMFQNNPSIPGVSYHKYNPNTNSWTYSVLNANYPVSLGNYSLSATNRDFTIASNKIYETTQQGIFSQIGALQYDNHFTYSDGLGHAFVKEYQNSIFKKGSYFYINKNNGQLENINLGLKDYFFNNGTAGKLGGYTPFMSPKVMWLKQDVGNNSFNRYFYRIIDDKINSTVYDIVVNHIDINDDNGNLRKVQYTYNKPKCTPDNSSTFYGEVIIENKGIGTGNIGKVIKLFNNGSEDLSMVGLPLEVLTVDNNNKLVKKSTTSWRKYTKSISNGSNTIAQAYYIRPIQEKEALFFDNSPNVVSKTTNNYNNYGLKTSSTSIDSEGQLVKEEITYAYQQYGFVYDENMLSFPYQTISKINNQTVNVQQSKWIDDNGKIYINENWSGPSINKLRLNNQISKVEILTGNVLENNNGKGLYNAVLFGYDNLYEVAAVSNVKYDDLINELDVTYTQLQNLPTASLKAELLKLYNRLPNAVINLSFYDDNGRVISTINERREEAFVYYDTLGREDYITDADGHILEKKNYHFGTN